MKLQDNIRIFFDGTFIKAEPSGIGEDSKYLLNKFSKHFSNITVYINKNESVKYASSIEYRTLRIPKKIINLISLVLSNKLSFESTDDKAPSVFVSMQPSGFSRINGVDSTIYRIHDIFPITNPTWFPIWTKRYFRNSLKTALMGSLLLCNSAYTRDELEKNFPGSFTKSLVIPCQLPIWNHARPCNTCSFCKEDLTSTKYLLCVGSMEPRKNYSFLLENWRNLDQNYSTEFRLIIVGVRKWKSRKIIKDLKNTKKYNVIFDYACDFQLQKLYQNAFGYISTSLDEGFDIPTNLAAQNNVPSLISDIPVHREHFENNACFFDPTSNVDFSDKLKNLLDFSVNFNLVTRNKIDETKHLLDWLSDVQK